MKLFTKSSPIPAIAIVIFLMTVTVGDILNHFETLPNIFGTPLNRIHVMLHLRMWPFLGLTKCHINQANVHQFLWLAPQ